MIPRRRFLAALAVAAGTRPATAQVEDLLRRGRALLEEWELDPSFVEAVQSGDTARLLPMLQETVSALQGEYVLDLAALQNGARVAVPLLEAHPDTRGYAAWLRTRLDYFRIADLFRRPRDPRTPPMPPRVNPTPSQERQAWDKEIQVREQPAGAAGWVPRLKPLFRKAGTPQPLVWLAEIESSFDPNARSPVGAVGMYQLMPATAQELGLRLKPSDERLQPEKNASAAARYLRKLHGDFKDWPLTLAAYNAGPGRVKDLLKRRRASSYDAIAPSLPAETQMYVPKLEAVLRKRERVTLNTLR